NPVVTAPSSDGAGERAGSFGGSGGCRGQASCRRCRCDGSGPCWGEEEGGW
ncbi:hypothetical protein GMDG_08714, partial [Pseudogymnoascus destructans 20631-21]